MRYQTQEIYSMFGGKLVGSTRMKRLICDVLTNMPDPIVKYITKNCWFMGSMDDTWAYTFRGNDLKNQHLVFISDELLNQDEDQIRYSIAHEIGHVVLNHRNSIMFKQKKQK